ncbi:MAG: DUF368 domain-containing protein [bacterium]|nr:DUF368 domain-containing protein [Myxococcales bacterium]
MKHAPVDHPPPPFSVRGSIGLFVRGFAMGAADVVPGVSGGTIAFITGIYEHFINALRSLSGMFLVSLVRGRVRQAAAEFRAIHWSVLIPLIGGIAIAIIALSKIITGLMVDQPAPTYAFFFGLILASAWVPLARVKAHAVAGFVALVLSAVAAWLVVGLQPDGIELSVGRHDSAPAAVVYPGKLRHPADLRTIEALAAATAPGVGAVVFDEKGVLADAGVTPAAGTRVFTAKAEFVAWIESGPQLVVLEEARAPLWWIFLCGVIAISAMVLPGLSGSFLLLFLGQYHAVFTALHQTVGHILAALGRPMDPISALTAHAWAADVTFFGVFLVGVVLGMLAFSRVVAWLFDRAHDVTMMALTGLMIGALRLPAEVVLAETAAGRASWAPVIGIAAAAAVVVVVMSVIDNRRAARHG